MLMIVSQPYMLPDISHPGEAPSDDISQTSGTIFFVSNEARQMITVGILPDDIPEGIEVHTWIFVYI